MTTGTNMKTDYKVGDTLWVVGPRKIAYEAVVTKIGRKFISFQRATGGKENRFDISSDRYWDTCSPSYAVDAGQYSPDSFVWSSKEEYNLYQERTAALAAFQEDVKHLSATKLSVAQILDAREVLGIDDDL